MRHVRPLASLILAFSLLGMNPPGVLGQPDPRIDEETGRSTLNYPPDRHVDHIRLRLEIDIPDMSERHLTAHETLTLAAIGTARDQIHLDAVGLDIRAVTMEGRSQAFQYDGKDLEVLLDRPVQVGEQIDLHIDYEGSFPHATGAGLTWTLGNEDSASLTDRAAQIHTQGQPESNSQWFPCHDSPNEQLMSELIVTVDKDYQVCSNGALVSTEQTDDGRTRWHWLQDKPHSTYLVMLVIGKFSVIGLGDASWRRPDLPLTVYAPIGFTDRVAESFASTPAMITFFEERFDEPFPWAKYSQLLVRRFSAGAMENTSATTFNQGLGLSGDVDSIISHELTHQWFGDLVAYKSWEHLWLGEGWATFGEALWAEHKGGEAGGRDAYYREIYNQLAATRINTTYAPDFAGLASKLYSDPDENFYKPNNPYSKGALVLHMLRLRLGDEVFFKAVAEYIDRFKFKAVETDDFRRVLEDVSGQSLERFFRQWVVQPGMPRLDVDVDWDEAASELSVRAEQTQKIDADNPAYAFTLPLYVEFEDGSGRFVYLPMDARVAEGSFHLDEAPADVSVDPNVRVGVQAEVTKDMAMWLRELDSGITFVARARAAEHLANIDDPVVQAALARAGEREAAIGAIAAAHGGRRMDEALATGASVEGGR